MARTKTTPRMATLKKEVVDVYGSSDSSDSESGLINKNDTYGLKLQVSQHLQIIFFSFALLSLFLCCRLIN